MDDKKKASTYTWIKIGGILSILPFVLVAGPIGGYMAGSFLESRFGLPHYTSPVLTTIGFIASVRETVRIIKFALRSAG